MHCTPMLSLIMPYMWTLNCYIHLWKLLKSLLTAVKTQNKLIITKKKKSAGHIYTLWQVPHSEKNLNESQNHNIFESWKDLWSLSCSTPLQVQNFVPLLEVPISPLLQPVRVHPNSNTTMWSINHFFQFCIICKASVGILCPTMK